MVGYAGSLVFVDTHFVHVPNFRMQTIFVILLHKLWAIPESLGLSSEQLENFIPANLPTFE